MALRQSALLDEMKGENYLGVPRCPECGGIVRPDVVLYEESSINKYFKLLLKRFHVLI